MAIPFPRGRRSIAVVVALLASGAATTACGTDDDGGGSSVARAPARPAAVIDMADLRFSPRSLTVARGDTVTFRNVGAVTHNAKGATFFSRVVEPGGTYRHTFSKRGRFPFVCTFHPGMEGVLRVR